MKLYHFMNDNSNWLVVKAKSEHDAWKKLLAWWRDDGDDNEYTYKTMGELKGDYVCEEVKPL